jgi:cytochrome c oxidase assembly factor CtaG
MPAISVSAGLHAAEPAYTGPPQLQNSAYLNEWVLNPWVLGFILIAASLYLAGVWRHKAKGGQWRRSQTAFFFGGLAVFALISMSFLGAYERTLFWPRAAQNTLLQMLVPMLLALGAPLTLLLGNVSEQANERIMRVIRSRPARIMTFPGVVSAFFLGTPFVLYLSPWFEIAMRSGVQNEILRFTLLTIGYYYYWARLRVDPVPHEYPHMVSVWITFAEAVTDGALGIILMWGDFTVAAGYYASLHRPFNVVLHDDQRIGGGAIWVLGDLAGLPFLAALWRRMFGEDRAEAEAIDAVLDELEVEQHAHPPQDQHEDDRLPEGHLRPWWESDPVLSRRYGLATDDDEG